MTQDHETTGGAAQDYLQRVEQLIGELMDTQGPGISAAADLLAPAIEKGGLVHVFGPGHSHIIAEEAFNRTGGLACINPIVDRTGGRAELVEGYAAAILEGHDLRQGEVMVISSNSGINPLPVEMALLARARGLGVVAITSLAFSRSLIAAPLERVPVVRDRRRRARQPLSGRRCTCGGARRDGESRARILDCLNDSAERDDRRDDRASERCRSGGSRAAE